MNTMRRFGNNRGFTLIEMAIVIIIMGIVISIIAGVLPSLIASSKIKQAQATLERMDYALIGYLAANGRCPCPDTDNDGSENRTAGATPPTDDTCAAYIGQFPYATVGLSSALDPWQEPVRYGIYQDLIRTQNTGLCAAAPCTLCLSDFVINPTGAYLHTSVDTSSGTITTNQAYVIVSGGPKDLDGTGGFFDARNGNATAEEFDTPNRITNNAYDDLVRANSFAYLQGKLCGAALGGSSSGGGGTVEGPSMGNCSDSVDNDLDGDTDCDDTGCATYPACLAGATFTITTATIPSGTLSSTYLTALSATGGSTPYSWSLTNNGGFADLAINAFTGSLSGTLDQCPGNYTVAVQAQDATPGGSGGPLSDAQSYTLQVTSNLNVTCTSTPGSAITWSSPTQVETFSADGNRLGTINWTLNTGGAAGFVVYSTGAATCALRKTGSTTPGTYTFALTATDSACATNTDDLTFDVTVTATGGLTPGAISGVVDTFTFSTFESYAPEIIHTAGNIYAIVDRGWLGRGYAHTVDIAADGQIGARQDYYSFDGNATTPDIAHVSGTVYAVAFEGGGNRGYVNTISVAADGNIANSTIDTLRFANNNCSYPVITQVSSDIFAIAYAGPGNDGFVTTIQIATDGNIANSTIDTLEFDTSAGLEIELIHISGDVYAAVYRGSGDDGFITTFSIAGNGQIGNTTIDTLEFDPNNCFSPHIVLVNGEIYAVAYQGQNNDGFVTTVQIAADGQITDTLIDSLEFDPNTGITPVIVSAGNGVFAIAYRGVDDDGFFCTVLIDDSGQIGDTIQDSIEFETNSCFDPSMVAMGGGVFAITYRGPTGNRGVVTTVSLQ